MVHSTLTQGSSARPRKGCVLVTSEPQREARGSPFLLGSTLLLVIIRGVGEGRSSRLSSQALSSPHFKEYASPEEAATPEPRLLSLGRGVCRAGGLASWSAGGPRIRHIDLRTASVSWKLQEAHTRG